MKSAGDVVNRSKPLIRLFFIIIDNIWLLEAIGVDGISHFERVVKH